MSESHLNLTESHQALGDFGEWRTAGQPWRLPVNHLAIGCCHQGSASPEPTGPVELWAVAFNLEGIPEFDDLWENPVREKTPVSNPTRLTAAFRRTATLFLEADRTDPLHTKAALLELFAVAREEFSQSPGRAQLRPVAVEQALEWMANHFHEPDLTLEDVAAADPGNGLYGNRALIISARASRDSAFGVGPKAVGWIGSI